MYIYIYIYLSRSLSLSITPYWFQTIFFIVFVIINASSNIAKSILFVSNVIRGWHQSQTLITCFYMSRENLPLNVNIYSLLTASCHVCKIGRVFLRIDTAIASRQISKRGSTSATRNSALNTPYTPLPYIFWTVWSLDMRIHQVP